MRRVSRGAAVWRAALVLVTVTASCTNTSSGPPAVAPTSDPLVVAPSTLDGPTFGATTTLPGGRGSDDTAPASPQRVAVDTMVFVGDSLSEESELFLPALLGDVRMVSHTVGGSAPCDWLSLRYAPSPTTVLVLTFHGNAYTSCMTDAEGRLLVGEPIVDRYYRDLNVLIDGALAGATRVLLVGQPEDAPDAEAVSGVIPQLNEMYQRLAAERGVGYVDAGASVETPDGEFAARLPCRPDEAECGPDGMNGVRAYDGQHFCPGAEVLAPCRVYAAGAYRFAKAIADAVLSA